jgi:nucleoside phosphorylase/CheY-like chemotaxis protein
MRVLIVHDREAVASQISALLTGIGIAELRIDDANDGVSARNRLRDTVYDVAIVDLTIPNIHGKGLPDYSIAESLLQEAMDDVGLKAPGDIIGLTQEPEALARIDTMVGANLMAIVHEDEGGNWRQEIIDRVTYCSRHVVARQRSMFQRYETDVGILTALDKEFLPYKSIFDLSDHPHAPGVYLFGFHDREGKPREGVAACVGRAGQAAAASSTQALLSQFRPKLALMSGYCGGVAGKAAIGDVLIAESVFDWDYGKWEDTKGEITFHPRPEPICIRSSRAHLSARTLIDLPQIISPSDLSVITSLADGDITAPQTRLAPYGSGSAIVGNAEVLKRIKLLNDNIAGIDMEAFGFYYAGANTPVARPDMLCIKSVSDMCDKDKDDKYQPACSLLAARTVEALIRRCWTF